MAVDLSRRGFARLLGTGFAVAALPVRGLRPSLRAVAAAAALAAAREARRRARAPANHLVRLNANENPYGPAPGARRRSAARPASRPGR